MTYELGLKIIFIVCALGGGVVLLMNAFTDRRAWDEGAAGESAFAGGVMVFLGLLFGLMLMQRLGLAGF